MINKKEQQYSSEGGFAIIMVMGAIALLAYIMADFTFETKLNKIKVINGQDRLQAKLNAQTGMKIALAKLKLYQEARNLLEKNSSAKSQVKPSEIESIVTQDFAYPIPAGNSVIQRSAIADFEKESVLVGQILVSLSLVTGFLNPNNLRASVKNPDDPNNQNNNNNNNNNNNQNNNANSGFGNNQQKKSPQEYIEEKLLETLKNAVESKKEEDDSFDALYGNLDLELLIKELKYYVNHPSNFEEPERAEIEALYLAKNIIPKHAPLTSLDEMYLLEGWPDEIVDLIKDELTVHQVTVIPVNDLTQDQLKILFPDITPIQIEEFFKHRDGDKELEIEPTEFKSEEDFKNLVVGKLGIVSQDVYDERKKDFESAGLKIGVAGKLFRMVSTGTYKNATYTLTAYIDLPIKPVVLPKKNNNNNNANNQNNANNNNNNNTNNNTGTNNSNNNQNQKQEPPPEVLLDPRVIEIIIT